MATRQHPSSITNAFDTDYYALYESSVERLRSHLLEQISLFLDAIKEHKITAVDQDTFNGKIQSVSKQGNDIIVEIFINGNTEIANLTTPDKTPNRNIEKLFKDNIKMTIGIFYLLKEHFIQTI